LGFPFRLGIEFIGLVQVFVRALLIAQHKLLEPSIGIRTRTFRIMRYGLVVILHRFSAFAQFAFGKSAVGIDRGFAEFQPDGFVVVLNRGAIVPFALLGVTGRSQAAAVIGGRRLGSKFYGLIKIAERARIVPGFDLRVPGLDVLAGIVCQSRRT
jgi:hypothetical protein